MNALATMTHRTTRTRAFSLLELLVVISIIGILAAVAVPAFKGFGENNVMAAAERQLMDDIAFARQKAITERTTTLMLFPPLRDGDNGGSLDVELADERLRSYAIFAYRRVGDQPGNPMPHFLTQWRRLPDGVLIDMNKFSDDFEDYTVSTDADLVDRPLPQINVAGNDADAERLVPFFSRKAAKDGSKPQYGRIVNNMSFYHIAFSPSGKVGYIDRGGEFVSDHDIVLSYEKGGVFYLKDDDGTFDVNSLPDSTTRPNDPRYSIRINRLTGKARSIGPEIGDES